MRTYIDSPGQLPTYVHRWNMKLTDSNRRKNKGLLRQQNPQGVLEVIGQVAAAYDEPTIKFLALQKPIWWLYIQKSAKAKTLVALLEAPPIPLNDIIMHYVIKLLEN